MSEHLDPLAEWELSLPSLPETSFAFTVAEGKAQAQEADQQGSRADSEDEVITYYLSGPMRGYEDYNFKTFMAVEAAIGIYYANDGDKILNPARNFDGDKSRPVTEYMNADLKMVLDADVIVLLPGWEGSQGAVREVQLAIWAGKEFVTALGQGDEWELIEMDTPTLANSPRAEALAEATQLITGDRNNAYGPPTQDFTRTAAMATGFGFGVTTDGQNYTALSAHHVAIFMILLKMSRLNWTPTKRDSWVDTAGYAGCGYEAALEEAKA